MPTFRFRGFITGTPVDLSASEGSTSGNAAVSALGQATATPITVSLSATRVAGTAPFGAIFEATTTSPAARVVLPYHDIENVWAFQDPGDFTALGNNPIWATNKDVAYGPKATHVHSAPGDYTVVCTAHDGENPAKSKEITVSVANPNTVFVGADTAVVSVSGNFLGAPSGASQFTSISDALSHLSGRQNMRLLLRAGETFTDQIYIDERNGGSGRKLSIGGFGSGARAEIDRSVSGGDCINIRMDARNFEELAIYDLVLRGEFDPTSPPLSGDSPQGDGINIRAASNFAHKTIWNVDIIGAGNSCLNCGTGGDQRNLYIGNCRFIGWLDYGLFIPDAGFVGISGTSVQQPAGTRNGAGKFSAPWYADHGPLRLSRPLGPLVVSNCDFVSLNSWSHASPGRGYQPCIRWNDGDRGNDQECVIDRFRFEGGGFRLYNETSTPSTKRPVWALADRIYGVSSDNSMPLKVELGGTTVRNGIFVSPNIPPTSGNRSPDEMFDDDGGGNEGPGWNTRRAEIYSCAFVDLKTTNNDRIKRNSGPLQPDGVYVRGDIDQITPNYVGNIIDWVPNRDAPEQVTTQGPLDIAGRWTPVCDGERWEQDAVDTTRNPGTSVTASFEPQTGSPAIGGATGKVSLLDMRGNLRSVILHGLARSTPSEGPYEPNLES